MLPANPVQHDEFGHHDEGANVEAGRKGGRISAERPPEARKEAARKAARTRAERYGAHRLTPDTCPSAAWLFGACLNPCAATDSNPVHPLRCVCEQ